MNTSNWALYIAIIGLGSTCTFALLNFRYTRRTNERAAEAEKRGASNEARSIERSRVIWWARISNAGYIILENNSRDLANQVRVEYSVTLPVNPGDEPVPQSFLRSQDLQANGRSASIFRNIAVKESIGPGEAVGLPVPTGFPLSVQGGAQHGWRFGLNLNIEWFTQSGSPKNEYLSGEDLGVVFSSFTFPDIESVVWESSDSPMEAVTPIRTPNDDQLEYAKTMRGERAASLESRAKE